MINNTHIITHKKSDFERTPIQYAKKLIKKIIFIPLTAPTKSEVMRIMSKTPKRKKILNKLSHDEVKLILELIEKYIEAKKEMPNNFGKKQDKR